MITLKEAEKINCASCKFSGGKCPLESSNNLCFPKFVEYLYNDKFTDLELLDIKSMIKWQEIYKKDKSDSNLAGAYANAVSSSVINAKLNNDKEIVFYALADTFLNEMIPGSRKNSPEDISKISKIVPWFGSKNKSKKKFDLSKIVSLESSYKQVPKELFYSKECIK